MSKRNLERDEVRGGVSKGNRVQAGHGHDPADIRIVTESIDSELQHRAVEGGGNDEDISSFRLRHASQARTFWVGTVSRPARRAEGCGRED